MYICMYVYHKLMGTFSRDLLDSFFSFARGQLNIGLNGGNDESPLFRCWSNFTKQTHTLFIPSSIRAVGNFLLLRPVYLRSALAFNVDNFVHREEQKGDDAGKRISKGARGWTINLLSRILCVFVADEWLGYPGWRLSVKRNDFTWFRRFHAILSPGKRFRAERRGHDNYVKRCTRNTQRLRYSPCNRRQRRRKWRWSTARGSKGLRFQISVSSGTNARMR